MKLLLVDDEPEHLDLLARGLAREGNQVRTATDGEQALARWRADRPDLVVLDVNLPKLDGFEVCRRIRQEEADTPIILLTGRREEADVLRALRLGADDYVSKPVSLQLLVARIEAVLRRYPQVHGDRAASEIQVGDLHIDRERRLVTMAGQPLTLSKLEYRLLEVLAIHTGHVVPYARLIESVWGVYDVHHSALLKTHLSRVRRKLGVPAGVPGGIRNIAGVGYVLNRPEVAPQGSTPQTSAAPVRQDQGAPARRTA